MLYSSAGLAQTITEKYNTLNHRYEYFDGNGNMIGHKTYDNLRDEWVYTTVPQQPNSTYIEPINLELVEKALSTKQSKYDANVEKINNAVIDMRNKLTFSSFSKETIEKIKKRFNSEYMDVMYSKKYDYSNNNTTRQIINWLYQGFDKIVIEETK